MNRRTRRIVKYITDVFINPAKSIALVFNPMVLIVSGCTVFGIVETIHCYAHIKGAISKYEQGQKSYAWMIAKVSIMIGRWLASLVAAIALSLFAILTEILILTSLAPIYAIAFVVSSVFSTLHKIRGLIDHCLKTTTPGLKQHFVYLWGKFKNWLGNQHNIPVVNVEADQAIQKSYGLSLRAVVGMLGTGLSVLVVFKIAVIMAVIANPIGFAIGCVIFGLMALQKAWKAYNEYYRSDNQVPIETLVTNNNSKSSESKSDLSLSAGASKISVSALSCEEKLAISPGFDQKSESSPVCPDSRPRAMLHGFDKIEHKADSKSKHKIRNQPQRLMRSNSCPHLFQNQRQLKEKRSDYEKSTQLNFELF